MNTFVLSDLTEGLKNGRFAFFLGAGFSAPLGYRTREGLEEVLRSNFPGQIQQARGFDDMVEELLRKSVARDEIVNVVLDNLKAEEAKGNQNPYTQLRDIISNCSGPLYIFTTNWDKEIDKVLGSHDVRYIRGNEEISELLTELQKREPRINVIKMHGDVDSPKPKIVLTTNEALQSLKDNAQLYTFFGGKLAEKRLLIMGYSMLDPDIIELYQKMKEGVHGVTDYVVAKDANKSMRNVEFIFEDVMVFLSSLYKNVIGREPAINKSLEIDKRIKGVISQGKPLVISGCKYSGKTYLKVRLGSQDKHEVVDIPQPWSSTEKDYQSVREAITQPVKAGTSRVPLVLLSHSHKESFKKRYKKETGKELFGSIKNINLQIGEDEARDIFLNMYVNNPEIRKKLPNHELCKKIIDFSLFEEGLPFGKKYRTYLTPIIEQCAKHINENTDIQKAVQGSNPNEELLRTCFDKEANAIDESKEHSDAISEVLVLPGSMLLAGVSDLAGGVSKILNESGKYLGVLLNPAVASMPFLNLVGLGAAGIAISLGVIEWKNGRKNDPLWNVVKAASHWNSLSDTEKRVIAYKFERNGALEPEMGYDYLESLLGRDNSQKLGKKIEDYFKKNPTVWDVFLNSDAGRKLKEQVVKEAIEQLSKLYDSRLEKIEDSVRTLQAEFSKLATKVNDLEQRLTALEGRSLLDELNKYDFGFVLEPPTGGFKGRRWLFEDIEDFLKKNPCGYIFIIADAGLGKTAIATECVRRFESPAYFFFDKARSVTEPEAALNYLTAQLINKFELSYNRLPPESGRNSGFLCKILDEACKKTKVGSHIVVVIDALDEAKPVSAGINWINLPSRLPSNVYFIVTQRPGEYPISTSPGTSKSELRIEYDDIRQLKDIEEYLEARVTSPKIKQVLEQINPLVTIEQFVSTLKDKSEGNFMYLNYVLADIERESKLDMIILPNGLKGYYQSFWLQMKETAVKQEGLDSWWNLYEPVLGLLGAAGEPVSAGWLGSLTGRSAREVTELVLNRWSCFLRCQSIGHQDYWAVIHQSFADFLHERKEPEIEQTTMHRRAIEYYLHDSIRWQEHNGYALRHLGLHLQQAGMWTELEQLIENRVWFRAQRIYDPSLYTFAKDVERLCLFAETKGLEGLPNLIGWSLLYSTLRKHASSVPLSALRSLALLGQLDMANHLIDMMASHLKQVESYIVLGKLFYDRNRSDLSLRLLEKALKAVGCIGSKSENTWALGAVVEAMARTGDTAGALKVAEGIGDEFWRAETLITVAEAMARAGDTSGALEVLKESLKVAEGIEDGGTRVRVLSSVAEAMARTGDASEALKILKVLIKAAGSIGDKEIRAQALSTVAEAMARTGDTSGALEVLKESLKVAEGIEDGGTRVRALSSVAEAMARTGDASEALEVLKESLKVAEGIEDGGTRCRALSSVAEAIARTGDTADALKVAEGIGDEFWRAEAVRVVVEVMARAGDTSGALKVAEGIGDEGWRAEALSAVAEAMTRAGDASGALKILKVLIKAAGSIGDKEIRAQALSTVAEAMARTGDASEALEVLKESLKVAEGIEDGGTRVRALSSVAEAIARTGDTAGALKMAEEIGDEFWKAETLITVAEAMARAGNTAEALKIAEGIGYEDARARALSSVAEAMARRGDTTRALKVLEDSLKVVNSIVDETIRTEALRAVAEVMARAGNSTEALKVAEEIEDGGTRVRALSSVAEAMARTGDVSEALEVLKESLKVAEGIADEYTRVRALSAVVEAIARIRDTPIALVVLKESLKVAEGMVGGPIIHALALSLVVKAMVLTGDIAGALKIAEGIGDEGWRAEALSAVAEAMTRAGNTAEALKIVEGIGHEDTRTRILSVVAEAMDSIPTDEILNKVTHFHMILRFARIELNDVLLSIGLCASELAKLGLLSETWKRYRSISEFISDQDAQ